MNMITQDMTMFLNPLLVAFKAFVASMPKDETYDPWSSCGCAVAQFAQTYDPHFKSAGFTGWRTEDDDGNELLVEITPAKDSINNWLLLHRHVKSSQTFGELYRKIQDL